ncbi:NADPH-dependent FMN reductase [Brevibacillus choshinensis]|uniref:NADPH-dependent FMN reductase n=1 Tax=Brevibacillus choshinensis TaxID=54911 RepID=UPI002E21D566|nr:NADPH-dependent FMN reductase [Brevibacillus choshinensis]MED4751995.1 NADPH-dependent FMN reductase [Brevibacillus choshinensis]MED4784257.1 NADPH-dependent FMN reductase [Brevibacillus choshinensis]
MAKIVILSGSPYKGSRLDSVLAHADRLLQEAGQQADWIHVRDLPAEDLLHVRFDSPAIVQANEWIAQADAVVIATPIYKAAYSGVLKAFLDLLPQKGLENKLILPVAIGGTIAHLLAIDYALKPVLSALGARHVLAGAFILDSLVKKKEDGTSELEEEAALRLQDSVGQLVRELIWQVERSKVANAAN